MTATANMKPASAEAEIHNQRVYVRLRRLRFRPPLMILFATVVRTYPPDPRLQTGSVGAGVC
jgi:hypothetical protein